MANAPRIADELELKMHLASMELRDRWQVLKPRVAVIERKIVHAGEQATTILRDELAALGDALRALRQDLSRETPPEGARSKRPRHD